MIPPLSARLLCLSVLALLVLPLAACDSGEPERERVGVSGFWTGDLEYDPPDSDEVQRFPVQLTLNDNVSQVTGSGSIELPTETLEFTVPSGLFAAPSLSLELRFDRPPQGTLSGNVSAERDFIDGTIGGPGIANGQVELTLSLQRAE